MTYKLKICFFVSGGGTNMQAVFDACNNGSLAMEPVMVISNVTGIKALDRAEKQGIPSYHISTKTHPDQNDRDQAMIKAMQDNGVDIVILAGYIRKVSPAVIQAFEGRIINIHPALLPKFGGEGMHGHHVHEAVIAAGEKESGPTVHLVDEFFDHGTILKQTIVPVEEGDTAETLQQRVLQHEYPTMVSTLQEIVAGKIVLKNLDRTNYGLDH